MTLTLCLILALVWGCIWAMLLQCTRPGRFLAARRAWLAVVVGVGVDLLILLALMPLTTWLAMCAVIGASSVGIVVRSLRNELREQLDVMEAVRGDTDQTR